MAVPGSRNQNGMEFTTLDRDNDEADGNCANEWCQRYIRAFESQCSMRNDFCEQCMNMIHLETAKGRSLFVKIESSFIS